MLSGTAFIRFSTEIERTPDPESTNSASSIGIVRRARSPPPTRSHRASRSGVISPELGSSASTIQ
jgi:hypothetical protein